jgi:hypothetical protein
MVRLRKPSVMLVAIEHEDEPSELGHGELAASVQVLRVRQPLPACQRMRNVRPVAVLVGPGVLSWAMAFVQQAARESGAVLLQLGPLVARDALGDWLMRVVARSQRGESGVAKVRS